MLAHFLSNEDLNSFSNLVTSNALENKHLLEGVQFIVPFSWKRFEMSIRSIKYLFESLLELNEEIVKSFENIQF